MGEKVAIIGVGQTKYTRARDDVNMIELVHEAVRTALNDADIARKDLDAVVFGNMEFFEGTLMTDLMCVDGTGAYLKPSMKIQTGGTSGAAVASGAYYHVASGLFDVVLAIGFEKLSDTVHAQSSLMLGDPLYGRWLASGVPASAALQARRYMYKYGAKEEDFALPVVKNRENAMRNPYAHMREKVTMEDVLNSRMLAEPIRLLHSCPQSDGACAMILASKKKAKEISDNPAWIKGIASSSDTPRHSDRDMAEAASFQSAKERAYKMAGIENPRKQIDVAELYDAFAPQELIWYEIAGLCKRGEGPKLIKDGVTTIDGELPVNTSGGVISSNPIGATAMVRIAEAAQQVRGLAGEHQVPDVETALAHGWGGGLPQFNVVTVLSKSL
jgi:acetyl-CoA C-acetyltransferase